MENILFKFLKAGLLQIGEDDQKLNLLEAAASDLAKQIASMPLLAYRFALVGFDGRVASSDPAIKLAETAVLTQWQTITNKIGASPVQVYRAVILRSLELAAAGSSEIRQAISLIAENEPVKHLKGNEIEAVTGMLQNFVETTIEEVSQVWINPIDLGLSKLASKVKKPQINKDELTLGLARAVGPQTQDNKPLNTPNPHWPPAGAPWAYEFASRASEAISATIQSAAKVSADELQEALRETVQSLLTNLELLAIRDAKSELLWVRISMYSPSSRKGYMEIDPIKRLIAAVIDVSRAVKRNAPPSVEYFLRELVVKLLNKKLKLSEVLLAIRANIAALPEGNLVATDTSLPPTGRRSWLDFALRANDTADFEEQTGVSAAYEQSASELAVNFYRELQIRKLLVSSK